MIFPVLRQFNKNRGMFFRKCDFSKIGLKSPSSKIKVYSFFFFLFLFAESCKSHVS